MSRKKKTRRPELLYIMGVEGANQEKKYFESLKVLINEVEERKYNIDFRFVEPFGGNPKCVAERVINTSVGKENKIAVFDYDGMKEKFEEALDLCDEKSVDIGYTNYCFDLWLVWHKEDLFSVVPNQHAYGADVKRLFGIGSNEDFKKRAVVERINSQIRLDDIKAAITRAESVCIDSRPDVNKETSPNGHNYYNNPDTSMHVVLKEIFSKVGI